MSLRRRAFRLSVRQPETTRAELNEELAFHVEARAQELMARGLTEQAAREESLRKLGGTVPEVRDRLYLSAQQKEQRIDTRERMHNFLDDIRYAVRSLARRPVFCGVAIVTLALGIGANAAIFSAVDALLLRTLPFANPSQLMDIVLRSPEGGDTQWSWQKFGVFRDAERSYQALALYVARQGTLTGPDPERVTLEDVTSQYLQTLGVHVALGSDFSKEDDDNLTARKFTIISHALWQRRFHGSPDVIGQTLSINSAAFQVIGVLPPTFNGLSGKTEAFVPIAVREASDLTAWSLEYSMIGRLRAGVSVAAAASEAKLLGPRIYDAFPMTQGSLSTSRTLQWGAAARALESIRAARGLRQSLLVLFGAVGMVLLIACVNIANLMLGRAASRQQEIAIRLAIGAGRGRLVRLLLVESVLLAMMGGVASIAIAYIGTRVLGALNPEDTLAAQGLVGGIGAVGFDTIRLDPRVLLFTFVITLIVGIAFGLLPALKATRASLTDGLKNSGAANAGSVAKYTLGMSRRALVVAQVSLAIVLLVGSGLMLKSLGNLLQVNAGFDPSNILTLRLSVPPGVVSPDSMPGFYDGLQARLNAIPGVQSVALADCPPLSASCNGTIMTFPDRPKSTTNNPMVGVHWVTPNWFQTLRVPLKRGRFFNGFDRLGGEKVVIINEATARKYFNGEDPIGRMVNVYQGGFHTGARVVGIVGDVKFGTIDSTARPDTYISYNQSRVARMMIFVKTNANPATVAPGIQRALHEFAPLDPVYDIRTMSERVGMASAQTRYSSLLLTLFAAMALALAIMGIYGVLSFAVVQRTREIGIRMALGANRRSVLALVMREGTIMTATGVLVGLPAAFALTSVLQATLFNVSTSDPATYVAIVLLVSFAALVASWIPARVAVRVDPVIALRKG